MRVAAFGAVYDGATAPPYGRRSVRRTTVCRAGDGTLYVSFRRGTDHESIDGHPITLSSTDEGSTWEIRYDGYGQGTLDDTPGQFMSLAWYETEPGVLMGTALWIDHSDPTLPFMNPETEGLLPEKIVLAVSTDGARTWDSRQVMDTSPHRAPSPCANHVLRLANGDLIQPYETHKEWHDPSPLDPRAYLRISHDGGRTWPDWVEVASNPRRARYYWDQRLAVHPGDGRLIAMFWTHDPVAREDRDVHIAWGSADARQWTTPVPTGLPGQHCQPVIVDERTVVAVYADRVRPAIVASVSHDFGRSWDRDRDLVLYGVCRIGASAADPTDTVEEGGDGPRAEPQATVLGRYDSGAGTEPGVGENLDLAGQWNTMVRYRFGHPRAILLPSGEVFAVWYGGDDDAKQALWARLALDQESSAYSTTTSSRSTTTG